MMLFTTGLKSFVARFSRTTTPEYPTLALPVCGVFGRECKCSDVAAGYSEVTLCTNYTLKPNASSAI